MSVGNILKLFGDRAGDAVTKKFVQLNEKGFLIPVEFRKLTQDDKNEALPAVVLIKEKRSDEIKGKTCVDGRK